MPVTAYYPTLLKKYSDLLDARVASGDITASTAETYLADANRLLESLVWAFSEEALAKIANMRGFEGDYGTVARQLKAIVNDRPREGAAHATPRRIRRDATTGLTCLRSSHPR